MKEMIPLITAESILLLVVLVILPIYSVRKTKNRTDILLKGLGLPQGSVRSMLALIVVGSFVIFLVFGGSALSANGRFSEIVAALTGIAGTIVGFYFGSGGSGSTSSISRNEGDTNSDQDVT